MLEARILILVLKLGFKHLPGSLCLTSEKTYIYSEWQIGKQGATPVLASPLLMAIPAPPLLLSALETGVCCCCAALAAAALRALPATGGLTAMLSLAPRSITGMFCFAFSAASAASFSFSALALAAFASAMSACICAPTGTLAPHPR